MEDMISRKKAIEAVKDALNPNIVSFVKAKMALEALPSAQPETHDKRTETHACDCISRQAAIDALDKRFDSIPMEQTTEILQLRKDLRKLPSAQPEKRTHERTETHACDCISRQAAIDALDKRFDSIPMEQTTEILQLRKDLRKLPSAQPEKRTHERTETHACDLIERQAVIDAILAVTGNASVRELYEHVQEHGLSDMWSGGVNAAIDIIIAVPPAQPEPCEDAVSREEAKWVVFCNRDHVEDQANAIDALPPVTLKAEHPDLSEYSDKLWRNAYERGRAETQQRWIPCSERLPEERQEILATTTDNAWGDVVIIRTYYKEMHKSVIAWMPLPEPYKEGES